MVRQFNICKLDTLASLNENVRLEPSWLLFLLERSRVVVGDPQTFLPEASRDHVPVWGLDRWHPAVQQWQKSRPHHVPSRSCFKGNIRKNAKQTFCQLSVVAFSLPFFHKSKAISWNFTKTQHCHACIFHYLLLCDGTSCFSSCVISHSKKRSDGCPELL